MRKGIVYALFLLIPLLYWGLSRSAFNSVGDYALTSVDPEYFHLYNGIVIADGELDVGYTAHPGTPLQYLFAVAARIYFLFTDSSSLVDDFLDHPQAYIIATNKLMNICLFLGLLFAGLLVHKYSGSIPMALAVQLSLFGKSSAVQLTGRLLPESLMLLPLVLIFILLIRYIYSDKGVTQNQLIFWALLLGFGTACKLIFAPVLLLPLVALRTTNTQKVKMVVFALMAFLLFAYPIVLHHGEFVEWVTGMWTHSGMHGGGEETFIDLHSARSNFLSLYRSDPTFFHVAGCSLAIAISTSIIQGKLDEVGRRTRRSIYGIVATLIASVFFTIKHFALHYFIPFYLFKFMLIILTGLLIIHSVNGRVPVSNKWLWLPFALVLYFGYQGYTESLYAIGQRQAATDEQEASSAVVRSLVTDQIPLVISAPYYGSPFTVFAHMNGLRMSFGAKEKFQHRSMERYPMHYQFVGWDPDLIYFEDMRSWQYVAEQGHGKMYVYVGRDMLNEIPEIQRRLSGALGPHTTTALYETDDELLWMVSRNSEEGL